MVGGELVDYFFVNFFGIFSQTMLKVKVGLG
jgi:hypothetical protein